MRVGSTRRGFLRCAGPRRKSWTCWSGSGSGTPKRGPRSPFCLQLSMRSVGRLRVNAVHRDLQRDREARLHLLPDVVLDIAEVVGRVANSKNAISGSHDRVVEVPTVGRGRRIDAFDQTPDGRHVVDRDRGDGYTGGSLALPLANSRDCCRHVDALHEPPERPLRCDASCQSPPAVDELRLSIADKTPAPYSEARSPPPEIAMPLL